MPFFHLISLTSEQNLDLTKTATLRTLYPTSSTSDVFHGNLPMPFSTHFLNTVSTSFQLQVQPLTSYLFMPNQPLSPRSKRTQKSTGTTFLNRIPFAKSFPSTNQTDSYLRFSLTLSIPIAGYHELPTFYSAHDRLTNSFDSSNPFSNPFDLKAYEMLSSSSSSTPSLTTSIICYLKPTRLSTSQSCTTFSFENTPLTLHSSFFVFSMYPFNTPTNLEPVVTTSSMPLNLLSTLTSFAISCEPFGTHLSLLPFHSLILNQNQHRTYTFPFSTTRFF